MSEKVRITEEIISFGATVEALKAAEDHLIILVDEKDETSVYTDINRLNALGLLLTTATNLINSFPDDMKPELEGLNLNGAAMFEDIDDAVKALLIMANRLVEAGVTR